METDSCFRKVFKQLPQTFLPGRTGLPLQLLSAPLQQIRNLVARLLRRAQEEFAGSDLAGKTIESVEASAPGRA